MLGVIATFSAKPGHAEEVAPIMQELGEIVRANEPGNKLFHVTRSRENPNDFVVLELYESDEAFKAHRENPLAPAIVARLGPLLAAKPALTFLDA